MLWFRNLMIYRLNHDLGLSVDELEKQMRPMAFTPCGSQDVMKTGWVSPIGNNSDMLAYSVGNHILICAHKEEKIIPASVIKQTLQAKIDKLEHEQDRKLKKIEKESLKDEVLHTLLPRAFSKFNQTRIWIDTTSNLVFVDAASAKRAEDTLALLRKSLGSLPVVPLSLENPIEHSLTQWVHGGDIPADFKVQEEAELKALLEGGGVIRCKNQDLASDEIAAHIEAGKVVTKLSLEWRERVQFILADDASLKRLKFTETILEQNENIDKDDIAQRFDADFTLMTGELSQLIRELVTALGGQKSTINDSLS